MDPQGSGLCSTPSRWSDAPSRRRGEEFPQALGFENLDPFFRVSKRSPCFTAIEEDGDDERLVDFELACEADGVAPPDPVQSCHC